MNKIDQRKTMMTSSNGNIFRVIGHLCGEFTGPRWIPRTKVSDAELWCFLCVWINDWVNNRGAGDLRRYRAHYDVIVMTTITNSETWTICTVEVDVIAPLQHSCDNDLTHWGRDKMAAIFRTTFSNAFSWMKMLEFRLRNHWNLFLMFELTISQHWFR